jgi:hypothetical protein
VEVANGAGEWFSFAGELPEVPEGGSATLDFTYAPDVEGWHWADVTVGAGEAARDVVVQVRGRAGSAAASVYPPLLDFGPVHLVNEGRVPISLEAMDPSARAFSLVDSLPIAVEPGSEALLTLNYYPRFSARYARISRVVVHAPQARAPTRRGEGGAIAVRGEASSPRRQQAARVPAIHLGCGRSPALRRSRGTGARAPRPVRDTRPRLVPRIP